MAQRRRVLYTRRVARTAPRVHGRDSDSSSSGPLTMRRLLIRISAVVAVFLIGMLGVSRLLIGFADNRVRAELEERGIPMELSKLDISWNGVAVDEVCLNGLDGAQLPSICARELDVKIPMLRAIRGDVRIEGVEVGEIEALSTMEQAQSGELQAYFEELARRVAGPDDRDGSGDGSGEPTGGERSTSGPAFGDLPTVRIDTVKVDLTDPSDGATLQIDALVIEALPDRSAARVSAAIGAIRLPNQAASMVDIPVGMRFAATVRDSERFDVELAAPEGERVEVGAPGSGSLAARTWSFRAPHTFAWSDVAANIGVPGLEFAAGSIEMELRELTTELEDLFVARFDVQEPRVRVFLAEHGGLIELEAAEASDGSGEGAPTGDPVVADGSGSGDAPPAADDAPDADAPAEPLWADREWWEKIPQQIAIGSGTVEIVPAHDAASITVADVDIDYALRAIRTQMDLELTGEVQFGTDAPATVEIVAVWNWANESLDLDLDVSQFPLRALPSVVPSLEAAAPSGFVSLQTRFRERGDGSIADFSGTFDGRLLEVNVPNLSERLMTERFSWSWAAEVDRDDESGTLAFSEGAGQLGAARFDLRPNIRNFDYEDPYLGDGFDVRFSVPDQDAMTLLYAIPRALLGHAFGAQLEGTWGMDIAFAADWLEEDPETGRRALDIDAPSEFEVRDADLHLTSLPEPIDVTRLNRATEFTFTGVGDGPGRTIRIPAPAGAGDDAGDAADAGGLDEDWVRLDEISYFLVAATLYREDGRFFTNRGINWYQWRAVLEQAWADRALGRGASTISMQTVKNVFLSHERTIERKFQELFLTYWMTRLVPKERILEVYFNVIEWGPGIHGVVEAADYYFGKRPEDLSLAESVWLSSIVPAPVRRGAQRANGVPADWSMRHCRDIMNGMHSRDWITATELAKGLNGDVRFVTAGARDPAAPRGAADLGLDPLAITSDVAPAQEGAAARLALSPPERLRALIASQIQVRP